MSEPDVSGLLTVAQAIAILDAAEVTPRVIETPLQEAQGMRLAEDVLADRDYPPFDKSLMDGFAVRCADLEPVPALLRVTASIPAGQAAHSHLGPGEAMSIMTGAPLPDGADGVVPIEDAETGGVVIKPGMSLKVLRGTTPGRFIARKGADAEMGQVVLMAGARLEAAQLAVAASVGATQLRVFAPPRVAVFATGDEIIAFDQEPAGAQIRNCNNVMVCAVLRRLGCRPVDLGIVPDKPEAIRRTLLKAIHMDAVVVTGGMSMGQFDFVPELLREIGVELKITRLRIKPGKPFIFGTADRARVAHRTRGESAAHRDKDHPHKVEEGHCHIFGLPGNPVSGFVCLTRLASRLLTRLAGGEVCERWLVGRLTAGVPANGPREFYQPVLVNFTTGAVTPLQWKGSADIFTLAMANALLARAENDPAQPEGTMVRVMEI